MLEKALFERLHSEAEKWRTEGWPCEEPLVGEILRWQFEGEDPERKVLKFLRWPQFQSLEVYWMLRSKFGTPRIMDLYKRLYGDNLSEFVDALNAPSLRGALDFATLDAIEGKIRTDDDFVKRHGLDALREAVSLPYPSYIFALTMGAGKTILISAIIATEFAMAFRQPERDRRFMRNALVFAPGKTILGSLREISAAPYKDILPPESYRQFNMAAKVIYPRDGDPEIHAETGGSYNIIVTNTEKIRLQANLGRGKKNLLAMEKERERGTLEANLRLQKIKSLPNLGVFSDEAHHTYGDNVDKSIKRVRATVNYIADHTQVVAVVNTTGTPYHKRDKPLAEVVSWYGIKRGIADNILKGFDVRKFNMDRAGGDKKHIPEIVREFFADYGDVALPNGAPAKIAFFFRKIEHLRECEDIIANEMAKLGEDVSQMLINTQESDKAAKEEFAALNDPASRKRVILLVGIGTEGWDCPSLFATALIKGKTTGIFALQASTRCLRQVEGNTHLGRMFLDVANAETLDREIIRTYGFSLAGISGMRARTRDVTLRIRKSEELPELEIIHERNRVVREVQPGAKIRLTRPRPGDAPEITVSTFVLGAVNSAFALAQVGEAETLREIPATTNPHAAAARLSANYHLSAMPLLKRIRTLYPDGKIPLSDLSGLAAQVEGQTFRYKKIPERIIEAMALIRVMDDSGNPLFQRDEKGGYFHTIRFIDHKYSQMMLNGLVVEPAGESRTPDAHEVADEKDVSFHYAPYNFDTTPEREFFEKIIASLNLERRDIRCFLFTGGLTGAAQTDFFFEYKGVDGKFHRYHPDFVVIRNTGEFLIVEIKSEEERGDPTVQAKERAVRRLEKLQPDKIRYNVVYSAAAAGFRDELSPVLQWINSHE